LLDQVLDLDAPERDAWMARLRVERPGEAAHLERLLDAEAELEARGFLSTRPLSPPGPAAGAVGQLIGAYRLVRPLGQGGIGSVWLAERSDGRFEGTVAVKLLNLALLDPIGSERFRREGTVLARLSHPHIARLLDAGVTEQGQPYLVLEHVDGVRLDRYADEHRLPPEERLKLFLDVLGAVGHAHANLIVHRDLKPSNILVAADGTVKLLDFGIAKLLEQGAGQTGSTLTDAGGRALTPEYAAPEQILAGSISTATDVYALGVLLYLLLSGRHPTGEGRHTTSEHLQAILDTDPPRLSATIIGADLRGATPERLRRRYAGDLDNIVAKALKKRPEERYPTIDAFADDLRRHLRHLPVSARPDSPAYRAGKFVRRNRLAIGIASLAVAALVVAAGRERQLREAAQSESRKSGAVTRYLVGVFGAADPLAPPEDHPGDLSARTLLDRGAARIDTALAAQPDARAELRGALGQVYANLGLYDQAATQLRLALEDRRRLLGPEHPDVAAAMDQLGRVLMQKGELDAADSLLREALRQRRRLHPVSDTTAESLDHVSALLQARNDFEGAEPFSRETLSMLESLHGDSSVLVAEAKNNLGLVLWSRGRFEEAAGLYRAALTIKAGRLGEDHPGTAQTVQNLAQAEQSLGHIAASESLYRRALASKRRALGPAHPSTTLTESNLAQLLYRETPRAAEAESLLTEVLTLDRRTLGEHHQFIAIDYTQLATVAQLRGKLETAEQLTRQSLTLLHRLYGPEHTNIALALNTLGQVLRMENKPAEAATTLHDAWMQYRHMRGDDHPYTITVANNLAHALRESGRLEESETLLRGSLTALRSAHPDDTALAALTEVNLARSLLARGRPDEAATLVESAAPAVQARYGPDDPRTAEALLTRGEVMTAQGDYAGAEKQLQEAQGSLDRQQRSRTRLAEQTRRALVRLYRAWGKPMEAQQVARTIAERDSAEARSSKPSLK